MWISAQVVHNKHMDYTVKEASVKLKVSPATTRRLIANGLLTAIRVGQRKFLIPDEAIEAYRGRQTMTAIAERKPPASESSPEGHPRSGTSGD